MDEAGVTGGPAVEAGRVRSGQRVPRIVALLCIAVVVPVGLVVGAVGGAFVKETLAISKGGETPVVAVFAVLNGLRPLADEDLLDLLPFLCDEKRDELLDRLHGMRGDLAKERRTVLEASDYKAPGSGDRVAVSVMVQGVSTVHNEGGMTFFLHGTPHEWRFETLKQRRGWTVCGWTAPEICGTYVRC